MTFRFSRPDIPLLVFTDLDGTLLDHDSYSFEPARPALARLRSAGVPVIPTTSKTLAEVSATNGAWTTFRLSINPGAAGDQLRAEINGVAVYSGAIPTGGPTSGAFQVGFRENHSGLPASNEGTWIDNVTINMDTVPVGLSRFELY